MRPILKGATDQSVVIRIVDSTTGEPETGVVAATSGLDLKYRREGAATVDITESDLAALTTTHTDGGMKHIGAGYYRLDVPDAAFATGADGVLIFGTCTGMIVVAAYHPLVGYNPQDGVRLGLTALPNAAADAAGGLPISDAGGLDLDARLDAAVSSRQVSIWAAQASTVDLANTRVNLVGSVTAKTGYALASDGLDSISITAPAGVASNFREMVVQVWRRFFKRTTKSSTQIKTYADNGTSVLTTQAQSSVGTDDEVGAAS